MKEIYTTHLRNTLQLNEIWFAVGVCYYGLLYLAPIEFEDMGSSPILFTLILNATQFLSIIYGSVGIENPKIGRKRTLIAVQILYTVLVVIALFV